MKFINLVEGSYEMTTGVRSYMYSLSFYTSLEQITHLFHDNVEITYGFSGQFFHIFEIIIFGFVVAIFDLVYDVDAIHGLC